MAAFLTKSTLKKKSRIKANEAPEDPPQSTERRSKTALHRTDEHATEPNEDSAKVKSKKDKRRKARCDSTEDVADQLDHCDVKTNWPASGADRGCRFCSRVQCEAQEDSTCGRCCLHTGRNRSLPVPDRGRFCGCLNSCRRTDCHAMCRNVQINCPCVRTVCRNGSRMCDFWIVKRKNKFSIASSFLFARSEALSEL